MGADIVAGPAGSSWGSRMWDVITAATSAPVAASKGTSSRSVSSARERSITGIARWESIAVSPWPGKCLAQAATPPACSPSTHARTWRATACGSVPKLRVAITGWSGSELMSATGRRGSSSPRLPAAPGPAPPRQRG